MEVQIKEENKWNGDGQWIYISVQLKATINVREFKFG